MEPLARRRRSSSSPLLPGQTEVEDGGVAAAGAQEELALDAVARDLDGPARLGDGSREDAGETGIVLDDQDLHGGLPDVRTLSTLWGSIKYERNSKDAITHVSSHRTRILSWPGTR